MASNPYQRTVFRNKEGKDTDSLTHGGSSFDVNADGEYISDSYQQVKHNQILQNNLEKNRTPDNQARVQQQQVDRQTTRQRRRGAPRNEVAARNMQIADQRAMERDQEQDAFKGNMQARSDAAQASGLAPSLGKKFDTKRNYTPQEMSQMDADMTQNEEAIRNTERYTLDGKTYAPKAKENGLGDEDRAKVISSQDPSKTISKVDDQRYLDNKKTTDAYAAAKAEDDAQRIASMKDPSAAKPTALKDYYASARAKDGLKEALTPEQTKAENARIQEEGRKKLQMPENSSAYKPFSKSSPAFQKQMQDDIASGRFVTQDASKKKGSISFTDDKGNTQTVDGAKALIDSQNKDAREIYDQNKQRDESNQYMSDIARENAAFDGRKIPDAYIAPPNPKPIERKVAPKTPEITPTTPTETENTPPATPDARTTAPPTTSAYDPIDDKEFDSLSENKTSQQPTAMIPETQPKYSVNAKPVVAKVEAAPSPLNPTDDAIVKAKQAERAAAREAKLAEEEKLKNKQR